MKKSSSLVLFVLSMLVMSLMSLNCGDGESQSYTNSSGQTCTYDYTCENDSCSCQTSGKEGQSCCDPDDCGSDDMSNCQTVCEVCN